MKKRKQIWATALILILSLALTGCTRLEILSQQLSETIVKTNGENDYSIKYSVSVRNEGAAGKVRATAKLFTPEGQFYREKTIDIGAGKIEELEFIFTEPTFPGALFGEGKTRAEFSYEQIR